MRSIFYTVLSIWTVWYCQILPFISVIRPHCLQHQLNIIYLLLIFLHSKVVFFVIGIFCHFSYYVRRSSGQRDVLYHLSPIDCEFFDGSRLKSVPKKIFPCTKVCFDKISKNFPRGLESSICSC